MGLTPLGPAHQAFASITILKYCITMQPNLAQSYRCTAGLTLLLWGLSPLAAQEPLAIGNRRQLLMDDKFVQQSKGIQFVVHPPRKTGDQIIVSEPGLALGGYHSALYEAGVYHLWYTAGSCVLYARSSDGIHWEKPTLGLVPYGGDWSNNIVVGHGAAGLMLDQDGGMVFQVFSQQKQRLTLANNPVCGTLA